MISPSRIQSPNASPEITIFFLIRQNITWRLTFEEALASSLAVDDMFLLVDSSAEGGKTFPERRCKLFVAPTICCTLLL
jgi:hypothetical protein